MKRVLVIALGLSLVLVIIWICCGNTVGVVPVHSKDTAPQFYVPHTQPQQTQPQQTQGNTEIKTYNCVIAQAFVNFDGPFLEDGSHEEKIGVAALELWNTDTSPIEFVQAVLYQGQRQLCFEATYIPPGGKVLVLEKNAQLYSAEPITDFQCPTVIHMQSQRWQERVAVEQNGMCNLKVTNLTQEPLKSVRIFYKGYDVQSDMYLGGITYCLVLTDMQAGQEQSVSPYRFATDYSRIVAVVIEE